MKARHLVIALHDHFSRAIAPTTAPTIANLGPSDDRASSAQRPPVDRRLEDAWAIQYIHVSRVLQLVEAIDDDLSTFVTVAEVNQFTRARPEKWR